MGKYSDGCPDSGHTGDYGCENSMYGHGFNPETEYGNGGGSSQCFPFDTLIRTPFGEVKIGDLKKGQTVISYDKHGNLVPRTITRKRVRGVGRVVDVVLGSGRLLRATRHHSFLSSRGWQKLADLCEGDEIVQADGTKLPIVCIRSGVVEPVYNIYTAGEHTFIANGCVAHNFTELRTLRTVLHRWFLDPVSGRIEPRYA